MKVYGERMAYKDLQSKAARFFKDDQGNIVIWQRPNIPLTSWFIFKVISMVIREGNFKTGFAYLSTAYLFTWAYLEIVSGKSPFRRVMGVIVLVVIVLSYFR